MAIGGWRLAPRASPGSACEAYVEQVQLCFAQVGHCEFAAVAIIVPKMRTTMITAVALVMQLALLMRILLCAMAALIVSATTTAMI